MNYKDSQKSTEKIPDENNKQSFFNEYSKY